MMFIGYYSDILEQDCEHYGFLHLQTLDFGNLEFVKHFTQSASALQERCEIFHRLLILD